MAAPRLRFRARCTREQFERQTKAFLPDLYRLAASLVSQPADRDDLVHDTYLKAFQAFGAANLRDTGHLKAWLFRILINTFRDQYRRRRRGPIVDVSRDDFDEANVIELAASGEPGPAELAAGQEFAEAARVAIAELPPEVRIVATLFLVEELSYREIADAIGSPIGTVMSRLARGRRILRQELSAYAGHFESRSDLPDTGRSAFS